jgi:predicted ATPase
VKMLVTSRARLHLAAEHELPVPPLNLPDLQHLPPLDRLIQVDAVQLFVTRARAVQPDFHLTETNAQTVAALCIHLDGLPLAIELAAARSKLLAPQALLTRLGHRLHVLTGGTRDLALRHQTLRSTIDWSYALLDAATQTLFRRLGVFVGGWSVEAAEAVTSELRIENEKSKKDHNSDTFSILNSQFSILDGLAVLLDNSLVQQHPIGADEEPRFTMLETLREYALEQLAASYEMETARRQHAIYYLGLAEVGAPKLQSTQWRTWQERLEAELENFRAALQWSLESGEAELGLRLGAALVGHWWVPGFLPEWYRQVQETAVTATSSLPPATRANILRHVGRFAFLQGDYARAMMLLEQGVVFCRETGDQSDLAGTLMFLADVMRDMSDYTRASMLYQESLDIYRQLDELSSLAWLYHSWSDMAMQQGEDAQGLALSQEGLRLFRALDAKPGMGLALHLQGIFRQRQGDDASALACLTECLVLFKEVGSVMGSAIGLGGLAVVMITLGQRQPADRAQRIATTRRAVQLLGAAESLREASTCPLFQVQRKEFDRAIPIARAVLDEATFMRAWTDGRAMSLEQAMAYALDEVG